jgi:hypothetical protein
VNGSGDVGEEPGEGNAVGMGAMTHGDSIVSWHQALGLNAVMSHSRIAGRGMKGLNATTKTTGPTTPSPQRPSKELKKVAHVYFTIGRDVIAKSLFPEEVKKPDGFVLTRPVSWK